MKHVGRYSDRNLPYFALAIDLPFAQIFDRSEYWDLKNEKRKWLYQDFKHRDVDNIAEMEDIARKLKSLPEPEKKTHKRFTNTLRALSDKREEIEFLLTREEKPDEGIIEKALRSDIVKEMKKELEDLRRKEDENLSRDVRHRSF